MRGDNDAARHGLDKLRRSLRSARPAVGRGARADDGQLAARGGRLEEARAAAARGIAGVEGTDEGGRLKLLWVALMVEAEGAERPARRAIRRGGRNDAAGAPRDRASAARPVGRGPALRRLAAAELDTRSGARRTRGVARRRRGFDEIALPWPVAYARLRAAEAYVALGDRAAAAAPLAAARDAAERWRRRRSWTPPTRSPAARASASRTAAPPEPEPAPFGLTPREHEVLLLVAEGRTNREIGELLFMSEKTASVHVSRILAKLDVGGPGRGAAVAHRLGLTAST